MKSAPLYVVLYLILMIPSYFMPLLGSNSLGMMSLSAGFGVLLSNPMFLIHAGSILALIALAYFRGAATARGWLVMFPIIALVFDFVPVLSSIPFVVTVMHLCAVIIGAISATTAPKEASHAST